MASDQARNLTQQAAQCLQSGQFSDALEFLDTALALDPNDSEAETLRGVALANLQQPVEATNAFRRAITLAPNSSKAHYNLAAHLKSLGDNEEALAEAREALRFDPANAGARNLVLRLDPNFGASNEPPRTIQVNPGSALASHWSETAAASPAEAPRTNGEAGYVRNPYETQALFRNDHRLPWVQKCGQFWPVLGWILTVTSLLSFVWLLVVIGSSIGSLTRVSPGTGNLQFGLLFWLYLASTAYMIFDLIDRAGNFLWLLPQILCGFCIGYVTLPVYLVANRR